VYSKERNQSGIFFFIFVKRCQSIFSLKEQGIYSQTHAIDGVAEDDFISYDNGNRKRQVADEETN
jgi:hypothetical protein